MTALARVGFALVLALPISVASAGKPPKPLTTDQQARKLYSEGEAAFTAGRFTDAVQSFQAAYELSHNRKLLWNIAQSWRRQYEISGDVADLRRARAVLQNVRELAESDSEKQEAQTALAEVEAAIAEKEVKAAPATVAPPSAPAPSPPAAAEPGRGRTLKITGLAVGVAGVALAGGGAVLAALGQRAFKQIDEPSPGWVFEPAVETRSKLWRPLGWTLVGVGAAAVAGGITTYVLGTRAESPKVTLVPALSPSMAGLLAGGVF